MKNNDSNLLWTFQIISHAFRINECTHIIQEIYQQHPSTFLGSLLHCFSTQCFDIFGQSERTQGACLHSNDNAKLGSIISEIRKG